MPTLNWIGKEAVVNHHQQGPFHLLRDVPELACGQPGDGNLIVQGDNLIALKALLPYYAGQVKCIYIDPPYNTGNEGWVYNDNVNSPIIREWLGKTVGKEGETLDRHDRWLCMMYPRLALLKQFLREDGVIFVSIDDSEIASLRLVMDEIFGRQNFVGSIVWKNATDNNPTRIVPEHEYLIVYSRNAEKLEKVWKTTSLGSKKRMLEIEESIISRSLDQKEMESKFKDWLKENKSYIWPFQDYKFIDSQGIYTGIRGVHNPGKEGYRYDVIHPVTKKACKEPMMGYRFPQETMQELLDQKRIIFGDDESKIIELKVYLRDYQSKFSSVYELDGRAGTNEIKNLFPESKRFFNFPKTTQLIQDIISFSTFPDSLVLDSFAGSGTTGHAVIKQNAEDGGNRRFILVEMEPHIARNVTVQRVRRVAEGYTNAKGERVEGLGGSFRYCELGEPLFDEHGKIRDTVRFADLARHVYLDTTGGEPLPSDSIPDTPLIGVHRGIGIYLLYNGILGDASEDGGNVLTRAVLAQLPPFDGPKIIYCAGCLLGHDRLRAENILHVRQTPYEIKVN